jgi:hypothetical protein
MSAPTGWILRRLGGNLAALSKTHEDGRVTVITDSEVDAATLPPLSLMRVTDFRIDTYPSEAAWLGTEDSDPIEGELLTVVGYPALKRDFPDAIDPLRVACAALTLDGIGKWLKQGGVR